MARSASLVPKSAATKNGIRLVFAAVILYFVAGLILRKAVGEIYPGLFMPSFSGIGLPAMTSTEGEIFVPRITVRFADGTSAPMTPAQLSGDAFFPPTLTAKFFTPANARKAPRGFQDRLAQALHDLVSAPVHPLPSSEPIAYAAVDPEAQNFLRQRILASFPGRTPNSVNFELLDEWVRLDHPSVKRIVRPLAARAVIFSERADEKN